MASVRKLCVRGVCFDVDVVVCMAQNQGWGTTQIFKDDAWVIVTQPCVMKESPWGDSSALASFQAKGA